MWVCNQQASKAIKLRNLGQRERNMHAKAGESDRAIRVKKVLPPINIVHCSKPDIDQLSRSTYLLGNGRLARRTGVDSHVFRVLSSLWVGVLLFSLIHEMIFH